MQNKPLVTIVVPCYNVERYLRKCLDSIVGQIYPNLDVILVNDGSKDNTLKICNEYSSRYPYISVINQENKGLSAARNIAIENAKGEYITFIDSDDYVSSDYVEFLFTMIDKNNTQIAITSCTPFYESDAINDPLKINIEDAKIMTPLQAIEMMFYQEHFDTTAWAKLYRTDLFSNIRYPVGMLFEDLPTTYKLFAKAKNISYVDYRSYFYLLRSDSIEGSIFSEKKLLSLDSIVSQLESDSNLDAIRKAVNCRIFSFLFRIFLSMPAEHSERNRLWGKIKSLRMSVLLDLHSRKKAKIAAVLSFLGIPFLAWVYSKNKVR